MLKKGLRKLVNYFGYEVRKKNILHARSATEYNSFSYANKFYGNRASVEKYVKEEVPIIINNLLQLLKSSKISLDEKTVVDVSCGTGHCMKEIQKHYRLKKITGTEYSTNAVKIAQETIPGAEITLLNIETDFLVEKFDIVLCLQVLEHLIHPEKALHHLRKMVAPEGILIVTVPDGRVDNFSGHINFWSSESFLYFLQRELTGEIISVGYTSAKRCLYGIIKTS
jgi:2-polyprenyl-3-methyl-5-hydroxy-6-metoxy-1,4-benzoquinol methylase